MNDSQILQRVLILVTKRGRIIDQALGDASLLSAEATVALKEIRSELDELREIQLANRGLTWEELRQRELELRQKYAEKKPTSLADEVSK
jgi:hypothetical protein